MLKELEKDLVYLTLYEGELAGRITGMKGLPDRREAALELVQATQHDPDLNGAALRVLAETEYKLEDALEDIRRIVAETQTEYGDAVELGLFVANSILNAGYDHEVPPVCPGEECNAPLVDGVLAYDSARAVFHCGNVIAIIDRGALEAAVRL